MRVGAARTAQGGGTLGAAELENPLAPRGLTGLQRAVGNAAVCRLLERGRMGQTAGAPLQRYPVGVPPDADCETLLDWMNSSNPYVPNWAQTSCEYEPNVERFRVAGEAPNFRLRLIRPRVTLLGCSIDMPEWEPSDPAMQRAWEAEMRHIRAHENEHVAIGRRDRRFLQRALQTLEIPVTAVDREDAMAQAEALFQAEWARIEGEAQERQRAIDPHPGNLQCPDPEEEDDTETEEAAGGTLGETLGTIGETIGGALGGLASWFGEDEEPASAGSERDRAQTEPAVESDGAVATNAESSGGGGWFGDLFSSDDTDEKDDDGGWWS
jgi:hypothetical protein